jgi:AcrR family transcriptional regulator
MARKNKSAPPKATGAQAARRLDSALWIEAALDALAEGGVEAVRVEPLAKALKVTKGSFYWHFADRRALIDAMLTRWAEGRIAAIRQQAANGGQPDATLHRLADLYTPRSNPRGLSIELAIRALARGDATATKAVQAVDRERLALVGALFSGMGWAAPDARARAILFYSYLFGESLLGAKTVTADARALAIRALIATPDRSSSRR